MNMRVVSCIILLLAVTLATHAQPQPSVTVDMTLMCWDEEVEVTYPGYDGESPITVPKQVRSLPLTYQGPRQFVLSKVEPSVEAEKPEITPFASVTIPPESKQVLVIFIRNNTAGAGDLPYRSVIIDDSFSVFPAQSIRMLNFTRHELAGQLGKKEFRLPSQGEVVVEANEAQPPKYLLGFRLMRQEKETTKWRPVRSTIFSLSPRMRILVFLLENPSQPFDLRFVQLYDYLEQPHPQSAEAEK